MERELMDRLVAWKLDESRKPLVLNGARQVGKTWLLREFGRRHYKTMAYVSLDNDAFARGLFEGDYDIARIVRGLSLRTGQEVRPGETLVVLDEAQACPKAITSLKYFCEDAPGYHVALAGSLLGLSATEGSGFPVGKVDMLNLYPLSLLEFLRAVGADGYADVITSGDKQLMNAARPKYVDLLKAYYIVGGMPAVVNKYVASGSLATVRDIQGTILDTYVNDFAKHIPARVVQRTREAWNSIPRHLAQENKRFVFGHVREGARAKSYEESLLWLEQAGLIQRCDRVAKPGQPLSAYSDNWAFKVFLLDVGLLGAMSELDPVVVLDGISTFTEFKGALTEQYVCQQLVSSCGLKPFYWSAENSKAEIDFLVQRKGATYPIEVKAAENLQAKSLRAFSQRYEGMQPRRFSLSGFRDEGWMRNIPLWAIGNPANWE